MNGREITGTVPGHDGLVRGRGSRALHVSVVCSGNICRSPIGEQMLRAAFAEAGLDHEVRVSSAGMGDWHVGQRPKVRLLRSFDPVAEGDEVPDPYLGSDADFDDVVAMTAAAVPSVLAELRRLL